MILWVIVLVATAALAQEQLKPKSCGLGTPILTAVEVPNQETNTTSIVYEYQCYCPYDYYGEFCQSHSSLYCRAELLNLHKTQTTLKNNLIRVRMDLLMKCFDTSGTLNREGIKAGPNTYGNPYANNKFRIVWSNSTEGQPGKFDQERIRFNYLNSSKHYNFTNSTYYLEFQAFSWRNASKITWVGRKNVTMEELEGKPFIYEEEIGGAALENEFAGVITLESTLYEISSSGRPRIVSLSTLRYSINSVTQNYKQHIPDFRTRIKNDSYVLTPSKVSKKTISTGQKVWIGLLCLSVIGALVFLGFRFLRSRSANSQTDKNT